MKKPKNEVGRPASPALQVLASTEKIGGKLIAVSQKRAKRDRKGAALRKKWEQVSARGMKLFAKYRPIATKVSKIVTKGS